MTVTLDDIAKRAQVSKATVSRVLNNHPNVADTVRHTVRSVADDLGYFRSGRRLRGAALHTVLVVGGGAEPRRHTDTGQLSRDFSRHVADGAQRVLADYQVDARMQFSPAGKLGVLTQATQPDVMGVLLLGGNLANFETARALEQAGVHCIIVGAPLTTEEVHTVSVDYQRGIEGAVEHLARAGRQRLALVNGPQFTSTSEAKFKGLRLGLSLHDLDFHPARVVSGDFTTAEGYQRTLDLLEAAPDVDAVLYADDYMAMGGLRALSECGRRVPEDVAVIGFHDYEIAQFTSPPLTTVRMDMRELGVVAAERLLTLLDRPRSGAWHIVQPLDLVCRASTASHSVAVTEPQSQLTTTGGPRP